MPPRRRFAFEFVAKVKMHELRSKSKQELITQLKELKGELSALRVAKVRLTGFLFQM